MLHMTIYTDRLPEDVAGEARGFFIRIRPGFAWDNGLHAHEREHVRQWWSAGLVGCLVLLAVLITIGYPLAAPLALAGFAAHPLAYGCSRRYRAWAEVKAYQAQMRHWNADGFKLRLETAAILLTRPRYRLGLTYDQAVALLSRT